MPYQDIVAANPGKPLARLQSGEVVFAALAEGEDIAVPPSYLGEPVATLGAVPPDYKTLPSWVPGTVPAAVGYWPAYPGNKPAGLAAGWYVLYRKPALPSFPPCPKYVYQGQDVGCVCFWIWLGGANWVMDDCVTAKDGGKPNGWTNLTYFAPSAVVIAAPLPATDPGSTGWKGTTQVGFKTGKPNPNPSGHAFQAPKRGGGV